MVYITYIHAFCWLCVHYKRKKNILGINGDAGCIMWKIAGTRSLLSNTIKYTSTIMSNPLLEYIMSEDMSTCWYESRHHEVTIIQLVMEGHTYDEISDNLRRLTGQTKCLSARAIQWYCSWIGIRYHGFIDQTRLDELVCMLVDRVGHSYGRRTMQGLLLSKGIRARVAVSLECAAPGIHNTAQCSDIQSSPLLCSLF